MQYIPFGDAALIIKWSNSISEKVNRHVIAALHQIESAALPGVLDLMPSYNELMILFDPCCTDAGQLQSAIMALPPPAKQNAKTSTVLRVPVCYGGEYGPDLSHVAGHCGCTEKEVIDLHSGVHYRVYMLGFTPGFCYLGGMPPALACPRKEKPALRVAAGSVGIAGKQTGVYPLESPGGWQIIGRTALPFFNAHQAPYFLAEPGYTMVFYPVSVEEHMELVQQFSSGTYTAESFITQSSRQNIKKPLSAPDDLLKSKSLKERGKDG
ncbi:MAG: 5-oxoprolinase subunit PxpB [Cyclobacteriaceae bacterium]|nr:5-oxoprolinase subunit PxpB [Cyclobacteriaceae bacterium]